MTMKKRISRAASLLLFGAILLAASYQPKTYQSVSVVNVGDTARAMQRSLKNRKWRINLTYKAHTDGAEDDAKIKVLADELFEAALFESDDAMGGDYLRYQIGGYEVRYQADERLTNYAHTIRVLPNYYTTADEENEVNERVLDAVSEITKNADETIAVTRGIHDYICDNVTYDTVHKSGNFGHIGATAYGALHYGTATCQGYAVLTYRLLKECGIENRIVTGDYTHEDGTVEHHAWNIVNVGGQWYNIDVTLDDVTETDDYFLKTDETFSEDHKRDAAFSTDEFCAAHPMAETE